MASMADKVDHTVAHKNREVFDAFVDKYDKEEWVRDLTARFSAELREEADWIGAAWAHSGDSRSVRMLDFACGPGMASHAFYNLVTATRGLDISSGMVKEYNDRAAAKHISPARMHAVAGNILASPPEPDISSDEFFNFDFVACCWALHHMDRPDQVLRALVKRLKPGGVLLVLDWSKASSDNAGDTGGHAHGHSHHGHHHHGDPQPKGLGGEDVFEGPRSTVIHHGFGSDEIQELFQEAGCSQVQYRKTHNQMKMGAGKVPGKEVDAFFCRGVRA